MNAILFKKVQLFAALTLTVSVFSSCKVLEGYLSNKEPLNIKTKSGNTITLPAGQISVRVKMNQANKMKLVMATDSGREVAPIDINFDIRNIQNGDKITIPSSVSGQPFDIEGFYRDVTTSSETYNTIESCTWSFVDRQCRDVFIPRTCQNVTECNPQDPKQCKTREKCEGGYNSNQCQNVTVYRNGQQQVSYRYINNNINFDLNLLSGSKIVGQIRSGQDSSNKSYSYQGVCR